MALPEARTGLWANVGLAGRLQRPLCSGEGREGLGAQGEGVLQCRGDKAVQSWVSWHLVCRRRAGWDVNAMSEVQGKVGSDHGVKEETGELRAQRSGDN